MFKQTLMPYTGQLLALCTSGWSVEHISRPWNMTLIAHRPSSFFFVADTDSTECDLLHY